MALLFVVGQLGLPHAAAAELAILPPAVTLDGPHARQQLVVERLDAGVAVADVTGTATFASDSSDVVEIVGGVLSPVANGTATITATTADGEVSCQVTVRGMDQEAAWEFRRHVIPVLSRAGCNMGACHGALAGKGGFRLSLRGYHPEGDYLAITREALGRRVELADPRRSLLIAKPSGDIPHKGGLRLEPDSHDYQVLLEWIQQGTRPPSPEDPRLLKLEVFPQQTRLQPTSRQQLIVLAHYADGRQEDVTAWAKFSSSDEAVAGVDDQGLVKVEGHGEGAIAVWFSSQIVLARITVPFPNELDDSTFTQAERANLIDEHVLAKLVELRLPPSPRCSDAEFIRRAYLDTIGRLPEPAETRAFLQSTAPEKRRALIDELLASEEYVDYWTYKWSDLLLVNGRRLRPQAVKAYYAWIRSHVSRNTPWDEFARELLTARGSNLENGATNFFALHQDPESMSENACQAFLGLSIGCAKCHNHPLEKWTNDEYYAMANFFSRVKAKGWGGDSRSGDGRRTIFVANHGELVQPITGVPQVPKPLDGVPLPMDFQGDRREYLADWMVSADNPYFTRAIVNRVWANYLGKGIIEPVDDLRVSNPARNEPLLAALGNYLVDAKYDLKMLMRLILLSETYQRTSRPSPENLADQHFFSRYYPRRLSAEVLLDAIAQVTEVPSRFTEIGYAGNDVEKTEEYPVGTRAIELYDSAIVSDFLSTFGRNERDITCECERSNTPSIVQVLHISNGTTINERLREQTSCVSRALGENPAWESVLEQAFLKTLCRLPTDEERSRLTVEWELAGDEERRELLEDLYWSLMSSREFLFNH